jgi:hypothetical protein
MRRRPSFASFYRKLSTGLLVSHLSNLQQGNLNPVDAEKINTIKSILRSRNVEVK